MKLETSYWWNSELLSLDISSPQITRGDKIQQVVEPIKPRWPHTAHVKYNNCPSGASCIQTCGASVFCSPKKYTLQKMEVGRTKGAEGRLENHVEHLSTISYQWLVGLLLMFVVYLYIYIYFRHIHIPK